jgi:Zn-finger nucleic acid-binding protein
MVCEYCGSEATPRIGEDGVQIVGESSKPCPVCKSRLSDGLIEAQPLLYCSHCHGMLLSMDKFLPLVQELRAAREGPAHFLARDADPGRILNCPLCSKEMDNHPYGGGGNVYIDSCEPCSVIWLDGGELRRIVMAPDREPLYLKYEDTERPRSD